jgi:hypothetical protein
MGRGDFISAAFFFEKRLSLSSPHCREGRLNNATAIVAMRTRAFIM